MNTPLAVMEPGTGNMDGKSETEEIKAWAQDVPPHEESRDHKCTGSCKNCRCRR